MMTAPRHALFPARVTLPDGTTHYPVRVATDTADITHAWAWNHEQHLPIEIGAWPADQLQRSDDGLTRRPRQLTAADGTVIAQAEGCGCGNPLRSWRPALIAPGAAG